jgi:hypothetical protein
VKFKHFAVSFILLLTFAYISLAEDISVSASVDNNEVTLGEAITLTVQVQGTRAAGAPALPKIEGIQGRYIGPSTRISVIQGQSSVSVDYSYSLLGLKTGEFTIPSLEVKYRNQTYRTDPIKIKVVPGDSQDSKPTTTAEQIKRYVQLAVSTKRKTAYLNEGIPLLIQLFIRSGVDIRNIRYPTFPSAGFSVLPFEKPTQRDTIIQGVRFRAINFRATVYPVTCGELALGPAELNCDLMVTRSQSRSTPSDPFFDDFLNRRARYSITVKSDPYTIEVKPLPELGRPESFSGAVGQYSLKVSAKPTALKVGEPITLTMIVKGQGNIDAVTIPRIADLSQFKVYDPQISVQKQGNAGEKTFEQVLIPRSDSVKAIPEIWFSYFDPEAGRYVSRTKSAIPIQVAPSDEAEPLQILEIAEGKAVKREVLGKDIVYIKDEIGSVKHGDGGLYKSKGFLTLQLIPLLGFAGVLVYQRRRDRFTTDRQFARQYHAPRKAKKGLAQAERLIESGQPQEFCSTIFKTMQEYLGNRFDLSFAGITIEIVKDLRVRGVSEEILEKLTAFFQACDRIRFARSDMDENEMSAILQLANESIKLMEDAKGK